MKIIDGGVTAPKGFQAAGIRAGIKASSEKKDMAMIYSEQPAVIAGTFTRNLVKAAPGALGPKISGRTGSNPCRCGKYRDCQRLHRNRGI